MRRIIKFSSLILMIFPLLAYAEFNVYEKKNTTLITSIKSDGTNIHSPNEFAIFYGGSSENGSGSPADCLVRSHLKLTSPKDFYGQLAPITTDITSYTKEDSAQKKVYISRDSSNLAVINVDVLNICADGIDFTGKYNEVEYKSEDYYKKYIEVLELIHESALNQYKKGEISEAIEELMEIAGSDPTLISNLNENDAKIAAEAINDLGFFLQKSGKSQEAIPYFLEVIKKFPNKAVTHLNIADSYWDIGDYSSARKQYFEYIRISRIKNSRTKIPIRIEKRLKK